MRPHAHASLPAPVHHRIRLADRERDGGTGAVMADGASYRQIMDTADWDRSVVTNVPGQSGQPESEFYGNCCRSGTGGVLPDDL